ncbi:MAG TPA: response regulator transcription factor [Anaerolineae bacterium]|nr:response regulator transcription factor [Anaerolineae bacterium]
MMSSLTDPSDAEQNVILIVDDEPANLRLLWAYLDQANFKVLAARDGTRALQIVETAQPDIILLDVMMPGLDGFETCRQLKSNPRTRAIPVIFMTALSETAEKVRGFDVGGVDYITKPAQPTEVLARVRMHLMLHALQCQLQDQVAQRETQVQERTTELMLTNAQLRAEVQQRQARDQERDQMLELIHHQNEYLQTLNGQLLQQQQTRYSDLEHALYEQVLPMLTQLAEQLDTLQMYIAAPHSAPTLLLSSLSAARRILGRLQTHVHDLTQDLQLTSSKPGRAFNDPLDKLSPRELEVFELLVQGLSPSEIGVRLNISDKTVYKHRAAVMEKLNMQSIPELVKLALQRQLIH